MMRGDRAKSRRRWLWKAGWRRCIWCGGRLSQQTLTCEHWVPRSLGGSNSRGNIVAACGECNHARRSNGWAPHPEVAAWALQRGLIPRTSQLGGARRTGG